MDRSATGIKDLTQRSTVFPEKLSGRHLCRDMPLILLNPKIHCRSHMHLPSVPIMKHFNPVQVIPHLEDEV